MNKFKKWLYRNRRYTTIRRDGLNILTETEESRTRRAERREVFNMLFTVISAVAAVVAAIFAAAAYINP